MMPNPRTGPSAPSTHALRNPGRQVQLSRPRTSKTKAVRASDDLRLAHSRGRKTAFNASVDAEFLRRNKAIMDIALAAGKSTSYVRSLLNSTSQFKAKRAPTLFNAVVHQRCLDADEDSGKTLKDYRTELQQDIEEGLVLLDMETDEKKRLLAQLLKHRELKRTGIRGTTKAAQLDARQTAVRIGNALEDLYERTGVRGIAVLSRGNTDDPSLPHAVESDGASGFFMKALGISLLDFLRQFEHYSCTKDSGGGEKNGVREMRREVGATMQDGLAELTKDKSAKMEYINYDVAIRENRGVELAGWPADIKMKSHVDWNSETLRRIRDGLRSGAIHWVTMTKTQREELVATHDALCEELGAGSLKPRKPRNDRGRVRGPQKNKAPGKRAAKKAAGKRRAASVEEDEDDEDEDDSSDEGEDKNNEPAPAPVGPAPTSASTAPFSFAPGAGVSATSSFVPPPFNFQPVVDSQPIVVPFDMALYPELQPMPGFNVAQSTFELDAELMEMLADPAAYTDDTARLIAMQTLDPAFDIPAFASFPMSSNDVAVPAFPISTSYATTALPNHTATPLTSSSGANAVASSSKRTREENGDKAPNPKRRKTKAKVMENATPAEAGTELPVKPPRKKRSDTGRKKGPRAKKAGSSTVVD
ncbi:hypothetical protein C8R46DRAFT_1225182 [Mycena filopes]|nr:hypothetical protein C8R46DRAFT_1225182 [Mycena filopes]